MSFVQCFQRLPAREAPLQRSDAAERSTRESALCLAQRNSSRVNLCRGRAPAKFCSLARQSLQWVFLKLAGNSHPVAAENTAPVCITEIRKRGWAARKDSSKRLQRRGLEMRATSGIASTADGARSANHPLGLTWRPATEQGDCVRFQRESVFLPSLEGVTALPRTEMAWKVRL